VADSSEISCTTADEKAWQTNAEFAREYLAGFNSIQIQCVKVITSLRSQYVISDVGILSYIEAIDVDSLTSTLEPKVDVYYLNTFLSAVTFWRIRKMQLVHID